MKFFFNKVIYNKLKKDFLSESNILCLKWSFQFSY